MFKLIRVRIRATGQVIDLMPAAALPRLASGEAEAVVEETRELAAGIRGIVNTAAKFIGLR